MDPDYNFEAIVIFPKKIFMLGIDFGQDVYWHTEINLKNQKARCILW
jgi:hypothetical protein